MTIAELADEHEEARWVAGEIDRLVEEEGIPRTEVAVFYRMNAQSRVLEDTLVRFDVPYQVIGGTKFYERAEIKDAVAYLTLLVNPEDSVSLGRVINTPRRGIGQTSEARMLALREHGRPHAARSAARAGQGAQPRVRGRQGDEPLCGARRLAARAG